MCDLNKEINHKCGGQCCRRFTLAISLKELECAYWKWMSESDNARAISKTHDPRWEDSTRTFEDIHLIYPMVVYLGAFKWYPSSPNEATEVDVYHYSCKHLDEKTGLCTVYNIRPMMCRAYPYGGECQYPGCSAGKKRKKATKKSSAKTKSSMKNESKA